jgi:adenine phosphoribosyltransferase
LSTESPDGRKLGKRIDAAVRHVADFPVEGFPFRDVTPLFEEDPDLFRDVVDALTDAFRAEPPDCIVCVESFGYLFGAPLAYRLGTRLALVRRTGKLPREVHREDYDMIYASGKSLEMHRDALKPGDRAVIVDDVLASGGSALATVRLIERCGARPVALACLAEVAILRQAPARIELVERGVPVVALAVI